MMNREESQKYWEQVAVLREKSAQKNADKTILKLKKLYNKAKDDIAQEFVKIFDTFSSGAGLDAKTAWEYISKAQQDYQVDVLRWLYDITELSEQKEDFIRRINAQAYGARMTRLEAVHAAIYTEFKKIALEEQKENEKLYRKVYEDTYYQSIHDIGFGMDSAIDFAVVSPQQIRQAITRPWYGRTFAESVWKNTGALADKVGKVIQRGIVTGASIPKMAKELESLSKQGLYAAVRLVRTETNYICNQAQLDAYKDAGIEKYKFLATLDFRTCEVCQPFDGKVFSLSEAVPGNNYPTMHPNCRCTTTVPETEGKRWANDGEHKYQADGNITYKQWHEQMSPEQREAFDIHVKQWKNKAADKKQYERYKERLGEENMPKSFAKFQELKHKSADIWTYYEKTYGVATGFVEGGVDWYTGKPRQIIVVNKVHLEGIPHSVTQYTGEKGGIDRNYYAAGGRQCKQISNHNHGNPKKHPYGNHGEHTHDYIWKNNKLSDRPSRKMKSRERVENGDIL